MVVMIVGQFSDNGYRCLTSSTGLAACAGLEWSRYIIFDHVLKFGLINGHEMKCSSGPSAI